MTKNKYLIAIISSITPFTALAQEGSFTTNLNKHFDKATGWFVDAIFSEIPITENLGIPWVVMYLVFFACFFTIYFKGINIRGFKIAIDIVRGKYNTKDKKNNTSTRKKEGEVSHFQALTAALSGTVGLGNISGVAIAISLGGPGATFWMIIAGLVGMTSKFAECTLGVKYRDIGSDGTVYGGPMYYLKKGLSSVGNQNLGKILAAFFAVMCIGGSFGGGNMFQSNQAAQIFINTFHINGDMAGFYFGVTIAILVGVVIIGGIKKIVAVTEKIVPFMVGVYLLAAFVVIGFHFTDILTAFTNIISGAFKPLSIAGGILGVMIQGLRRGVFSNEAGVGSAAIAHSAVKTQYPSSEGIVALLEPFIDTVVVCTITALVIIITNENGAIMTYGEQESDGVLITSKAFASVMPWFPYILTLAVILFAFSTMISWSYYGLQSWLFLFGRTRMNNYIYKILFCIFIVIGASISLEAVINFSDAMIFAMSIPNLIGVTILLPKIKEELEKYLTLIKTKS